MPKPNILLITCDELRMDFLGCYGGDLVATPNIDALAQGGTIFRAAYAPSPLCLPSRCSLITGQYPHHHGAYSNSRNDVLSSEKPNLYNVLKNAGYHTSHFGKCHYTPAPYNLTRPDATIDAEPIRSYMLSLGMDHLDLCNGKNNSIWFWNDYSRELEGAGLLAGYRDSVWASNTNGKSFAFPGPKEWHPDWWTARKMVAHLEECAPEQPNFLWCSFPGPHYPHDPPEEYLGRVDISKLPVLRSHPEEFSARDRIQYDAYHGNRTGRGCEGMGGNDGGFASLTTDDWRRIQHHYLANIALIDDAVGMLVDSAKRRFDENLIVILTADHGDNMGAHGLWSKNACSYEEVLRVPLLVHGLGWDCRESNARVNLIDILSTCCRCANAPVPPDCDGRPLQQSLEDGGHGVMLASMDRQLTVHDGHWKLVQDEHSGIMELYDLESDPDEYINLAEDERYVGVREQLAMAGLKSMINTVLR